eukprot:c26089_g1_i1.p2 GENE.c26089_g1_i1~~c26089_g1_i1.p2  ORF type:complete len:151 (-),score=41.95 c26089_g1_i1:30-482(-)
MGGSRMSQANEDELREAFALYDKNGDGKITTAELRKAMAALGKKATQAEIEDMIHDVDVNQNGTIEFNEFLAMMTQVSSKTESDRQMLEAFKVFDKDGNGKISHAELKAAMKDFGQKMSDAEVTALLQACDKDGDGLVDYHEFIDMMGNQ